MIMALGSSFGSSFSEQSAADPGSRVLGKQGRNVGVSAGDADIGVAEHLLDHRERDPLVQGDRRGTVPHRVHPMVRQPGRPQDARREEGGPATGAGAATGVRNSECPGQ